MAMCPKCWQEKPFLAERCPHCTADIPLGRQAEFSFYGLIGGLLGFAFVIWVISLLIS